MKEISVICLLLFASVCARQHNDDAAPDGVHNFGIYGGKPAKITEAPFMAMFRPKDSNWFCGASIINKQFLISAGHCTVNVKDPATMRITVGSDSVERGQDYEIEKIVTHPNFFYNNTMLDFDLSVIKLKKELQLSDRVSPIAIADSSLPKTGEMLQLFGFGRTEDDNNPSKVLLTVDVPFVDKETCVKKIRKTIILTKRTICAGGKKGQSGCNGDSGGPVVYKGKLIGAVSCRYTDNCAEGAPDGYSYIPSMMDFVNEIIKQESENINVYNVISD